MINEREYLLICLAEECAEIQHRATKALRFGLYEIEPGQELNNYTRLRDEMLDFLGVMEMFQNALEAGPIINQETIKKCTDKQDKVRKFMAYSRTLGLLSDLPKQSQASGE